MKIEVNLQQGTRNDLVIVLSREEVKRAYLHIANRAAFMALPGLSRHRPITDEERAKNKALKISLESSGEKHGHLELLGVWARDTRPKRPAIAIGNRNLGNNHGFVAWQEAETPRFFCIKNDPLNYESCSCLVMDKRDGLAIRRLQLAGGGMRFEDGQDVADRIEWATYGQQVLRAGRIVSVQEIIHEFYDIRHVLAFDRSQVNPEGDRPEKWFYKGYAADGRTVERKIYEGYPAKFRQNALDALGHGIPRSRYMHSAVGLSRDSVIVLQREGTVEEIASWLREAGAEDGLIFDNGGSVFTWAWFVNGYRGGFLFSAPDFRPPSSAVVVFELNRPQAVDLPSGSVSPTVL